MNYPKHPSTQEFWAYGISSFETMQIRYAIKQSLNFLQEWSTNKLSWNLCTVTDLDLLHFIAATLALCHIRGSASKAKISRILYTGLSRAFFNPAISLPVKGSRTVFTGRRLVDLYESWTRWRQGQIAESQCAIREDWKILGGRRGRVNDSYIHLDHRLQESHSERALFYHDSLNFVVNDLFLSTSTT